MKHLRPFLTALLGLAGAGAARAEFLFAPSDPTPNGLYTPTIDYGGLYEYSAWDIFYAPYNAANYPDLFAPYGGVEISPGVYAPVRRSSAGFPTNPLYNPSDPYAFWDTRNATITQTLSSSAFIIGPDISGNIYTFQNKTAYSLKNTPDYGADGVGTVLFQFQTDGSLVDFSTIKLVYYDANHQVLGEISALNAEYLREYQATSGAHWSATAGYSNRVALQWDTSVLTDTFGNHISSYEIVWASTSSSMSFQKADLVTSATYEAGIPIAATWKGGNGVWSHDANWSLYEPSGLTAPQENGNLKFANTVAAVVTLDASHAVGELIFQSPNNVTINAPGGAFLTVNTGVTTQAAATGTYTINSNHRLGALNFFEINGGTVRMNGVISGNYGLVKSGAGSLVLAGNNTFTGFLGVQGGTVRIEGTNTYTGSTAIVNGTVIVAGDAGSTGALGSNSLAIAVGADESLYHYAAGNEAWLAELLIDGDHTVSRDVDLAPGAFGKRLGALHTTGGATFSGGIHFTTASADPDAPGTAAGNVKLTAQTATDRLTFSGAMTGGAPSQTVTVDGAGLVRYTGVNKTYNNATSVTGGTLEIASGTALTGQGDVSVATGAKILVQGALSGNGNIAMNGGELIVHGSLGGSGTLAINGGTLAGSGTIGRAFTLDTGDVLSPGNSVGTLTTASETWAPGGRLRLEISDVDAGAGLGWDRVIIQNSGTLSLTANSSGKFTLELDSLTLGNTAGAVHDFTGTSNYSWLFLTASGGITGFNTAAFAIDTSGFLNSFNGTFSVSQSGNDLYLNFQVIPEPSFAWLLGCGAWLLARRRRGQPHPCCECNGHGKNRLISALDSLAECR